MDGLLTMYKGAKQIKLEKPSMKPMSQVAERNKYAVSQDVWHDNVDDTGYDSDQDPEASDDRLDLTNFDPASREEARLITENVHI